MANSILWLAVFVFFATNLSFVSSTVCDSVYKDDYYIQGVILGKNSHVFINDHVYEFDSQQFQTTNQIRILGKRGVHVEKFFEGVYLKGAKIFYVIMDVSSYQLYFVLTSDSEAMLEKVKGFSYSFESQTSYEVENFVVAPNFPFVFFQLDNTMCVYQIPKFTIGKPAPDRLLRIPNKPIGLFEFDLFHMALQYKEYKNEEDITDRRTLPVRSIFEGNFNEENASNIYFVGTKDVWIIDKKEFSTSPIPDFKEVLDIHHFLKCDSGANEPATNWFIIVAAVVVVLIIIIGIVVYTNQAEQQDSPPDTSVAMTERTNDEKRKSKISKSQRRDSASSTASSVGQPGTTSPNRSSNQSLAADPKSKDEKSKNDKSSRRPTTESGTTEQDKSIRISKSQRRDSASSTASGISTTEQDKSIKIAKSTTKKFK